MADGGSPGSEALASAVSDEMLQIYRDSYGVEARSAKTFIVDGFALCVLEGIELGPGETVIRDAGRGDLVLAVRAQFEDSIEERFMEAFEGVTGRKVVAFVSHTHFDPDFAFGLFRLAPDTTSGADAEI
jgi:uncharacterized protein YbcI